MWLMNEAKGAEKSLDSLARRMLAVNFASIHTTSIVSCIVAPQSTRHFLSFCIQVVHASVVPPSCQSRVHRTPPSRSRSRRGRGKLDESWNGQNVQDRQFLARDSTARWRGHSFSLFFLVSVSVADANSCQFRSVGSHCVHSHFLMA